VWKEGTTRLDINIVGQVKCGFKSSMREMRWAGSKIAEPPISIISHLTDRGTRSEEHDA
jgi:hypothetical protein